MAMLTDPGLRDELDRVAAAVGVRVVHLGGRHLVSRKTWSAAAAVVLDHAAADRCGRLALPRRTHVSVLTGTEAATATWAAAITVGAARGGGGEGRRASAPGGRTDTPSAMAE